MMYFYKFDDLCFMLPDTKAETYGGHLVALAERQKTEVKSFDSNAKKYAGKEMIVYYCQLQRQLHSLTQHSHFSMAALSVGITERCPNLNQ